MSPPPGLGLPTWTFLSHPSPPALPCLSSLTSRPRNFQADSWGVGGSSLAAGPPLPHDGQEAKTQRRAGQVKWAAGGSGRLMTTASPSVAVVASEGRSSPKLPNVFLLITHNSDGAYVQAILQLC